MAFGLQVVRNYKKWVGSMVAGLVLWLASVLGDRYINDKLSDPNGGSATVTALAPVTGWVVAHTFGLLGWALATIFAVAIYTAYRDERKRLAARKLEHYGMHLLWLRSMAEDEDRSQDDLVIAHRGLQNLRGDLLNLTPSVFSQATADAFRSPALVNIEKERQATEGLPDADSRATLLAYTNHLLDAVRSKWIAYGGHKDSSTP